MRLEVLGELLHPRAAYIFMLYSSTSLTASDSVCVCVCVCAASEFMHRSLYLCEEFCINSSMYLMHMHTLCVFV